MTDPTAAARDLAAAEHRRRRGAELVLPHGSWWYLMICLQFALLGAIWDTPMAWRWVPGLAAPAVLVVTFLVLARRKARPLPIRFGRRYWLLAWSSSATAIGVAIGAALALRALAVPLPFTLSGLLLGIGASLLARWFWRWQLNYVEQVARGPW